MATRFAKLLMRLYPPAFRDEFETEILGTLAEQHGELGPGFRGRLRFWYRQLRAITSTAAALRADERRGRRKEQRMDGMWRDVRQSFRALVKRPGFAIVATLTLGLGIGATTAMFSAVHAVLLRQLPYEDADRVITLYQLDTQDGERSEGVSAANIRDVDEASRLLSHAAVADPWSHDLMEDGRAISLRSWAVSPGFFEAIGARPTMGRTFLPEEYNPGGEPVVIMGHATWQSRFGGDPSIVGSTIVLDGGERTVVGVLSEGFKFPQPAELWSPRPHQPYDERSRAAGYLTGVARLAPGATVEQARSELEQISRSLAQEYPRTNANVTIQALPLREYLFGDVQSPLLVLMGAVALVLLIAAANVTGLQLARGAGRTREYALRGALGASSRRLLRLVTIESGLLALAGCALGVALAYGGVKVIRVLAPDQLPRVDELSIDGTVLLFALAAAVISAVVSGVLPAMRASSTDLQLALSEGGRGSFRGRRAGRLRDRLVIGEIALALVLSIGAGLLVRSFDRLLSKELGFETDGRLAVQVFAYDNEGNPKREFVRESMDQIAALPGVETVALSTNVPLADDQSIASIEINVPFTIDQRDPPPEGQEPVAAVASISPDYPAAMGIPIREGRGFSTLDHAEAPPTVMINEALARRHFPDESPIGQRITVFYSGRVSREIVGVLADVRPQGFESEPVPEVYMPLEQVPSASLTYVVASQGDAAQLATPVQAAIWQADATQAIWATRTFDDLLADWMRQRRFNLALLGSFALLALSLAAIGVYGLMSFSVEQRVSELGIRRALGGESRDLLHMVLRRGATLAIVGIAVGLVGSIAATRLIGGMLYEVGPFDPLTFGALSTTVLVVAVLAAWVPARRATRVDPMVALRAD